MKKIHSLWLVMATFALLFTAGCSQPQKTETAKDTTSETEKINAWFDKKYEEALKFSPIELTFLGRKDLYDQIDDFSLEGEQKQFEWQKKSVKELKSTFDYDALSEEAKMSYDLWVYSYELDKAGQEFLEYDYIFNQMSGAHSFLPTFLISFHEVTTEEDMVAYISRIRQVGRAQNQLLTRAKNAAEKGIRPPKFAYEKVLIELNKLIDGQPFTDEGTKDSALWQDAQRKLKALIDNNLITVKRAEEMQEDAKQALKTAYFESIQNIMAFIESDLPKTDKLAQGVSALPNGEAYYKYKLREETTTQLTADEIHALGLKEVERLRKEMVDLKNQAGFSGDLQAFFKLMRESVDDPRFFYPDTDEGRQAYIDDATNAINNIKKQLPNYFGILPKADLVVKRVEAFREQDGAAQHYYPGTPDGSRPGIYYAHLSDMTAMPKPQLEVIAFHEGIPGHHMQISIAQELEGIPTFRRQESYTAYVEGWALYSELMAKEIPGTYPNVYSDFGRLTTEMWRAIRLVVDTGLHAKGWTEQQAIDFFAQNSPEPITSITSEVQRYLVLPGQATTYKIGMETIRKLRRDAETTLGEDFDLKAFHDTVLGGGALPLTFLEKRVMSWENSVKNSTNN